MKLIIILTSLLLALSCHAESDAILEDQLSIFGVMFDVPPGYKQTRKGNKSSAIYSFVNPRVNIDGEDKVGYLTYSHVSICGELCSAAGENKYFILNSASNVGEYTIAIHTSNDLAKVEVYSIQNGDHVLVVGGDKALFYSWLCKLGVVVE